uniref:Zinc knuckle CX2CX4HX4C n=1 Tax=Tanacetum cinerariifolium TaxID=118510 RepID=A0A6L2J8K5_TANCI|nr:hypothetical protein [Tanacetum cinerariifolium]
MTRLDDKIHKTLLGNGVDVFVPVESIRAISARFANTVYGFFLGKRVAYLVVANYVRNTWDKYGLVKSMLESSTGIFSFYFSSTDGLDAMLENDPWSSYARTMIEVRVDVELKDTIVVAIPKLTGKGFYTFIVRVEYEWKPARCAYCKVFDHTQEECPKNPGLEKLIIDGKVTLVNDEGELVKKVDYPGDHDSEDEVASVDNDMARSMASENVGFARPFGGELEKVWMNTENLLLSSLPRGSVRPPGNGCTNTGNGGNPCIGSRKLAGRIGGVAAPTQLLGNTY